MGTVWLLVLVILCIISCLSLRKEFVKDVDFKTLILMKDVLGVCICHKLSVLICKIKLGMVNLSKEPRTTESFVDTKCELWQRLYP